GAVHHLANRDVTLVAVSRAPLPKFAPFKQRMGWRFKWYSSFGTDFNRVFHTYSTYGRGVESFINAYNLLDLAPKGRDEQNQKPIPMAWVRHHDKYDS